MTPDYNQAALGTCPHCESEVPPVYRLIEYEKDDGSTGVFAECPQCTDVVEPA
ncbi:phage terminase large subunit family protein [Halomicrobium urmianum]|uniref:phage terminase large subunit family protein n=1 Tax=Halomicrobium urmianum TaxID=1586233 RepID=UPI001CD9D48F|nr:phage terminase large subunit family protein [Halomicrobium urmianum]